MELRQYQLDIIQKTINSDKSTLIQIPTGGGKTIIAREIIIELVGKYNKQVLFVAPKIILMKQTAKVFRELKPHVIHGNNQYDKNHKVLVSTIQTASKRDINPDVIIIDEIHYGFDGKMIEQLIRDKPNARIIGLSATPYDKSGKKLGGFDLILDEYDIKYMVENKYLVDIKPFVLTKIRKLETVKVIGGDYNLQDLSKIMCNNQTVLEIVGSTTEYIEQYKKTIVFAVDINHAELLTTAYQNAGFVAKALHSKLSSEEIEQEIKNFEQGKIKILVSVMMLTTGFDVPDVDVAVIARPTKSQNLYKQMVGRVLRLADNKEYAVLLDCGNVIENLGMPLDSIREVQAKDVVNDKQKCDVCHSDNIKLVHIDNKSFWECKDCKHLKSIEEGAYKCKICNKLYTSSAKFIIKNNKLFLDCVDCPYPTLISEYTGSEIFVEADNTSKINANKSLVQILAEEKRKQEEAEDNNPIKIEERNRKKEDEEAKLLAYLEAEKFLEGDRNIRKQADKLNSDARNYDRKSDERLKEAESLSKEVMDFNREMQSLLTQANDLNKEAHRLNREVEGMRILSKSDNIDKMISNELKKIKEAKETASKNKQKAKRYKDEIQIMTKRIKECQSESKELVQMGEACEKEAILKLQDLKKKIEK